MVSKKSTDMKAKSIVFILFLFSLTFISSMVCAQNIFEDKGDVMVAKGAYIESIQYYRAAKIEYRGQSDIVLRLDKKIEDAQKKEEQKLINLQKNAEIAYNKANESQNKVYSLAAKLIEDRIKQAINSEKDINLAMWIAAFGIQYIATDPPNNILSVFMENYFKSIERTNYNSPIPQLWLFERKNMISSHKISKEENAFAIASYNSLKGTYSVSMYKVISDPFKVIPMDSLAEDISNFSLSKNADRIAFTIYASDAEKKVLVKKKLGTGSPKLTDTLKVGQRLLSNNSLVFSNSNNLAAFSTDSVYVWDTDKNSLLCTFARKNKIALNKTESNIFLHHNNTIFDVDAGVIHIWNYASKKSIYQQGLNNFSPVVDMVINGLKNQLIVACENGQIIIWNYLKGTEILKFDTEEKNITKIAQSDDGTLLLIGFKDGKTKIWTLNKTQQFIPMFSTLDPDKGPIVELDFVPGTTLFLSVHEQGFAKINDSNLKTIEKSLLKNSLSNNTESKFTETIKDFASFVLEDSNRFNKLLNSNNIDLLISFFKVLIGDYYEISTYKSKSYKVFEEIRKNIPKSQQPDKYIYIYSLWAKYLLYHEGDPISALNILNEGKKYGLRPEGTIEPTLFVLNQGDSTAIYKYIKLLYDKKINSEKLFKELEQLAKFNLWNEKEDKQLSIEKIIRLLGIPILFDSSITQLLKITPLQTRNLNLSDLIDTKNPLNRDSLISCILGFHETTAKKLKEIADNYSNGGNRKLTVHYYKFLIRSYEDIYSIKPNLSNKANLYNAMGNISYNLLFFNQFSLARDYAERALKLNGEWWIKINLAHALLLLGKEEEAMELYIQTKDKKIQGKPGEKIIEEDFQALVDGGILSLQIKKKIITNLSGIKSKN
jgi:tetratricopeptide (TPR) repeat protein